MKKIKLTQTEQTLVALKKMQRGNIGDLSMGICGNLPFNIDPDLKPAFKTWKHYSGNKYYPVPAITEKDGYFPAAEMQYDNTDNKWSRTTKYGRLRRNLLRHLISVYQAKVDKIQSNRKAKEAQ